MKIKNILYIVIGLIVMFAIMKQCESEPKVVTKTETIVKWKTDSVFVDRIVKGDKVYIEKTKTIKGIDSIIYKDKSSENTITANEFKTTLTSNKATADLNIISTGEILDVKGTITYPEKETTTTITKIKDKSGFYAFATAPIKAQAFTPELGVLFQIRNKMFVSGSVQYNNLNNNADFKIGVGIKLF